jgi:hypothetical protein
MLPQNQKNIQQPQTVNQGQDDGRYMKDGVKGQKQGLNKDAATVGKDTWQNEGGQGRLDSKLDESERIASPKGKFGGDTVISDNEDRRTGKTRFEEDQKISR